MPKKKRLSDTVTTQQSGCRACDKSWTTGNANQMAALHYDKTGHQTWCRIVMDITYGDGQPPTPEQIVNAAEGAVNAAELALEPAATPASNDAPASDGQSGQSKDASESKIVDNSQKSEMVRFRCKQCGREQGERVRGWKGPCFKCGGAVYAYVEATSNEWREPAKGLTPKPIVPEQSIEEFLAAPKQELTGSPYADPLKAAGPPKSIEELIEDRTNPKPVEAGPKFEF